MENTTIWVITSEKGFKPSNKKWAFKCKAHAVCSLTALYGKALATAKLNSKELIIREIKYETIAI